MRDITFSDTEADNSFFIRRILTNLEAERMRAAFYAAYTHARSVGDEEATEAFREVISDTQFMRRIGYLDSVKSEAQSSAEYYDKDQDTDPYVYDEETEKKISQVTIMVLDYAGKALAQQGNSGLQDIFNNIGGSDEEKVEDKEENYDLPELT